MNKHAIEKTELNKILSIAADYCTLEGGKARLLATQPVSQLTDVKNRILPAPVR